MYNQFHNKMISQHLHLFNISDQKTNLSYYVRTGDTLHKIGCLFHRSVDELKKVNKLKSNQIHPNEAITIPYFMLPKGLYTLCDRGEPVKRIQLALYAMGYDLSVNGNYDRKTSAIIKSVQEKFPEALSPDGIYNADTKLYLENLIERKYHIVQNPASLLTLVNKQNSLSHDYIPKDMIIPNIIFSEEGYDPKKLMRREAAKALEQLFAKASKENIPLTGVSAYRSFDRQVEIFKQNILESPNANTASARPGESEHQTGLSIDVSSPSVNNDLTQSFGDTMEGQWLAANAPLFGFIIRFPKGKEWITGYQYEPWHIRYVGTKAAKEITSEGLTLEEYFMRVRY